MQMTERSPNPPRARSLPDPRLPARPARRRPAILVAAALALLVALIATMAPSALAQPDGSRGRETRAQASRALSVTHDPVVTTLVTAGSDGHQLGDLRVTSIPVAHADGSEAGRLDASLLTTGIDQPGPGDEIRISTLVFTLGDPGDQVVVSGSGPYPAAGSTIALDSVIVRPIVGGSGRYAGATGWAESEHLADDTWRHTLHVAAASPGRVRSDPPGLRRGQRLDRPPRPGPATTTEPGIGRTLLGDTEPETADGETLGLWHYRIPAGSVLPAHTHPGDQVARIVRGVLTYEVVFGVARVVRADGLTEIVGAGQAVRLEPGDTVIESAGMVHLGSNEGPRPVELISATLFETGAEPATPVDAPAPAATASP
jgi:quercetin dioxygenase-like cupin family protein